MKYSRPLLTTCKSLAAASLLAVTAVAHGETNVATTAAGAHITYKPSAKAFKNKESSPEMLMDGNAHSRFIVTGAPYTLTVELPTKVLIDKISFAQSDYGSESAPKDLEIAFDDGQTANKALDGTHPPKGAKPVWQDVPVGREIRSVRITVLSVTEGAQKYGGLSEIALYTSAASPAASGAPAADAYKPKFAPSTAKAAGTSAKDKSKESVEGTGPVNPPADYDAAAPVLIHANVPTLNGDTPIKATVPAAAAPGEHPRLLFTTRELADFKHTLESTERGKATLATFMGLANGAVKNPPVFPSPEDTAAAKPGVAKIHEGNAKAAQACGFAYALTKDEKYARQVRDILVGYAERYDSYPRHAGRNRSDNSKITFQRLSEAMWFMPIVEGYDYIYDSKSLSDADRKNIDDKLLRPAIFEIRRKVPKEEVAAKDRQKPDWRTHTPANATVGKFPNWINFFNSATMMAGSVLNDKDMIDLAAAGFRDAVARGIGQDGMWGEGAINYQLFAMGAMSPGFEAGSRLGIDLWNTSGGRFKQLFDSPLLYAYPDGTMPGINDSARGKLSGWQTMIYHYGYARYHDPRYAYLVNASSRQLHTSDDVYEPTLVYEPIPEPPALKAGSVLFGSLGYSILRDDTKYALMDSGPHGGVHGHYDKLNLILYFAPTAGVAGDEMGGEPVFHFYDQPLHDSWTVHSIAHNTVTVDEHNQAASTGRMLVYEDTPEVKLMRAEAPACYPNVLLDRTVITTPTVVIDLFHGTSGGEHTWDRTLRYRGTMVGMPPELPADAKALGDKDGYPHVMVTAPKPAADQWTGDWQTKVGGFTATLAGTPGQEIYTGMGPDKDAMAIARQKGKGADFAAAYTMPEWKNPVVSAAWLPDAPAANGAKVLEVKQQDGATTQIIVAHRPGEWTAAGWHSDARVLYISTKGDAVKVLLGGGKFAQNGNMTVQQGAPGNYLAQKQGGGLSLVSKWMPSASPAAETTAEETASE